MKLRAPGAERVRGAAYFWSIAATRCRSLDSCESMSNISIAIRLLFASIAVCVVLSDKVVAGATSPSQAINYKALYSKREESIPMRDGLRLFTQIFVPRQPRGPLPILLFRTPYGIPPYGADKYPKRLGPSRKFVEDQFIFVYQDVRGRFQSEGQFVDVRPIKDSISGPQDTDETTDSYDTIDWLLKNIPGNNGKVGIRGTSYPGFYAACALIRSHPALVAVSPQAPMADLYLGDDAYHNGAFFLAANFDFYTGFWPQNTPVPFSSDRDFNYGTKDGYEFYLRMGSLANSERLYFHGRNPYWTDMYRHTSYDSFWQPRNILPHLRNVKPAVLVVGGWYDAEDLSGALKTFAELDKQSSSTSSSLVMGPWYHGAWNDLDASSFDSLSFGSNTAAFFQDEIELPFFRRYLKDDGAPSLPKAYVFETGKNLWKKLPQWPPAGTPTRLYFQAAGRLSFEPPAAADAFDEYLSDPNDPVPFLPKPALRMERRYMVADQRFVSTRKDVLTYSTEPLTSDFTIAGPVSPRLYVSTSATDSDFDVKLIDVSPDGFEQLVRGEPFRGKFRKSFEHPQPFEPGRCEQIRFAMPAIYHSFLKGHRLMVQVQSSWFPLTDRNPQSFTEIPSAASAQFVKATQRLYRSRNAASFLEFDVER
jgi:putative CocE/NonD family hydrolase